MNEYNYKNLTPFKWFILENFPFIEESFDALTNWQLFCKLGEEMNKIIDKVNESGEEVENLSNAFISLQNYINNYFSNLDVQDEINNKLDEMAETQELQQIILNYLNTKGMLNFDTVQDLINYDYLIEGAICVTNGYYNLNDGKGSSYKIISDITGYDTTNLIELPNNLYALDLQSIKYERPFKILMMSDIHYTGNSQYGYLQQQKLQMLLNDIMNEHNKQPIDFILILGDLSTDNYGWDASSATRVNSNYVKKLFNEFLYKLPCPVYTIPGNHDSWNNTIWKSITGYDRQYSLEFDDTVFIMLDTFNDSALNGAGATYKGVDTIFLTNELKKFKDKKIFLCAHYFDKNNESETFKNIVKNNDNIIALFCGHTHNYRTYNLGEEYGNKNLYMTGNYSYSLNGSTTVYNPDTTWGFRMLEIKENGLQTSIIRPTHYFDFDNNRYTHNYSIEDIEIINRNIVYKNTANFKVEKDKNNNVINEFLNKLFNNVYTLKDSIIIEENTDLNEIQDVGVYISPNRIISESLNCGGEPLPWNYGGFKLINEKLYGNIGDNKDYITISQTLRPNGSDIFAYYRTKSTEGTWNNWKKVLCDKDLDTSFTTQQTRIKFGNNNKSSLWFYKSNKVVTLRVQISFEDLQNLNGYWLSNNYGDIIPENYKPAHQIAFGYYSPFSNEHSINCLTTELNANTTNFKIGTGNVPCSLENVSGEYIYGNITYITV